MYGSIEEKKGRYNKLDKDINYIKHKPSAYKALYYAGVIILQDTLLRIPSRHFRKQIYRMLGAEIGKTSVLFRRQDVIYPYGLQIWVQWQ